MFELYPPLLMLSGVLLLVLAVLPWQATRSRVISGLFGLGFLGYGFYLEFIFTGGHYILFYYAFVVPVLMVIQSVKGFRAWQARKAQPAPGIYPGAPVAAPPQFITPGQQAPAPQGPVQPQ